MKTIKIVKLFTVALLALSQSAFAQIAAPPSLGGQIQQIPPALIPQRPVPEIRIEQGSAPAIPASDNVKILVTSLHVTGQALYSEAELVAITGFSPGGERRVLTGRKILLTAASATNID